MFDCIKFVEMCGLRFKDYFKSSTDNFAQKCSPVEKCFICKDVQTQSSSSCRTSNIGYTIICKTCKQRDKHVSYEGESARNGFLRGKEHLRDYEKQNERSVLFKHVKSDHPQEKDPVEFQMKIVGKFNNPLSRQINESIRIRNKEGKGLLNSKSEFHGPCIKRKILER